jgi:hypothetical protein
MSKSTRSDDHPPDRHPIPAHTHNTMEKGTVLPGYGNPIPVPVRTHDWIIMVLPIPMSLLIEQVLPHVRPIKLVSEQKI